VGGDFKRAFRLDRWSRSDARASVDDELEHHVELCVEELVEAGWESEDARREALRQFGDMHETKTYCEDMQTGRGAVERRAMAADEVWQDFKYALRMLRKAPGYAGLVIVTLAFGVAANTTIFSLMNPYLFRPLPYESADELVQVNQANPITGWDMDRFSYPQYEDWKARTRAFSDVAAYTYGSANITGEEGAEQVQASHLTANMFDVLGAQAALGRTFLAEDGLPNGPQVVVLGHGLWQRRYASDPGLVGRTISMDGVQRTVIGVMPENFNFPFGGVKLWMPVQVESATANRGSLPYQLVGRLNEGWTRERASAELLQIQQELGVQYPDVDGRMEGVTVKPLREALNFAWDMLSISFKVLLGAVAFVLMIACVNVASLTLARGSSRQREMSVRAAMGARRSRIIRQLLTESVVLAGLGGVLGIGFSYWAASMLNPVLPEDLYRIGDINIDRTVLAFSLLVTFTTPVVLGLIPALKASKTDLSIGLKEGSKGSGGLAMSTGRRLLVVAQVAFAVVLMTGAGLMVRSFVSAQDIDLGFDADRIVVAEALLPTNAYPSREERLGFVEEAVRRLERTPGVAAASAVSWLPLNHESITSQIARPSMAGAPAAEWPLAILNYTHPGYFETMGIELLEGRNFGTMDAEDSQPVVIVSDAMVNRFWPNESPIGQSLLAGDPPEVQTYTVVGVVSNVLHGDLMMGDLGPQMYRPTMQAAGRRFFLVSCTSGEPADLVAGVREAMQGVNSNLLYRVHPMDEVVQENQLQWSIGSVFLGAFGGGALLLATLGIYGLISFSVSQRERELGVRIALGANASEIRGNVVGDGVRLTVVGLVIGLPVALLLGRFASAMLYEVSPYDPATLAGVMLVFVAVSAFASFLPAARASRTDPAAVLRSE
jgi:putative ABC transport system permease protein